MAIQKIQNLHICHPFDMVTPNNEAMKFRFGFLCLYVHMLLIMPDEFQALSNSKIVKVQYENVVCRYIRHINLL